MTARPRRKRDVFSAGTGGTVIVTLKKLNINAPARGLFLLLLFFWTSKRKVDLK